MRLHFFNSAVIANSKMDHFAFKNGHEKFDWGMVMYDNELKTKGNKI